MTSDSLIGKFLPTRRTPGISTSHLLERLVSRYRLGDFDGKLEKIGHGELSARGSQYDDSRPASRMGNRLTPNMIREGGHAQFGGGEGSPPSATSARGEFLRTPSEGAFQVELSALASL